MKTIKSLTEAEIAKLPTLPEEWKWARLGELVNDIVVGYVGPITQYLTDNLNNGVRFLSTTHIGDNQFLNHKEIRYVTIEFSGNNKKSEVLSGDIIVARHGDSGKCCIIPPYIKKAQVSNAVIIRPNNELFVNLYIIYSFGYLKRYLQKKKVGGVQQVVNTKTMEAFPFPLPPLPEQRAIVSKIEQLFSELDNGIANLKLAQEQLKVYRQAVLKKAFEGELTKKWREQQTDLPNAGELLEQIRKEREEAVKATDKKLKKVKDITEAELVELPRIPEGWAWTDINQICFVDVGFAFKSSEFVDEGIRLLRGDNIEPGSLRWNNTKCFPKEKIEDYKNLIVKKDEIILAMDRPLISSGLKLAMAKDADVPCLLVQRMARFQPISIDNKYLYYSLQTKDFIHHLLKGQTGTQLPHISETNISSYVFSLPSIAEQKIIVEEIETRLSVCDKIEQDIETNLEKAEALRQSILKKAFEGKLLNEKELSEVRGAEDWEPAGVLLEKIKAEINNKG